MREVEILVAFLISAQQGDYTAAAPVVAPLARLEVVYASEDDIEEDSIPCYYGISR